MPNLYILAGCNGAGKTSVAFTLLPEIVDCKEFVNADEIARGLSPFQPETVAFEAGRIMLSRIDYLLKHKLDFAFETTLSTRSYVQTIKQAKNAGYTVSMVYVCLESVALAKERVRYRVLSGGHNIPVDVIERRYFRSLQNLQRLYLPLCDHWIVVDNSQPELRLIAQGSHLAIFIVNHEIWTWLKQFDHD